MQNETMSYLQHAKCQQALAGRLLQLADDSQRVGLHREASALVSFAASVLNGGGSVASAA